MPKLRTLLTSLLIYEYTCNYNLFDMKLCSLTELVSSKYLLDENIIHKESKCHIIFIQLTYVITIAYMYKTIIVIQLTYIHQLYDYYMVLFINSQSFIFWCCSETNPGLQLSVKTLYHEDTHKIPVSHILSKVTRYIDSYMQNFKICVDS